MQRWSAGTTTELGHSTSAQEAVCWRMILKPFSLAFPQSSEHSFAEAEMGGLSSEYRVSFCMTTTGCLSFCCCAMQVMKVKNSCSIVVPSHDRQFTNLNFDHRSRVERRSRVGEMFCNFLPSH